MLVYFYLYENIFFLNPTSLEFMHIVILAHCSFGIYIFLGLAWPWRSIKYLASYLAIYLSKGGNRLIT